MDTADTVADGTADRKRQIRREMRSLRRGLPDIEARSARLWAFVRAVPAVHEARVVMAFDSVHGEPLTAEFVSWCRASGKTVVMPEDDPPPNPEHIDVAVVPGTAFTAEGHRLGQGGGWYDRFLPQVPATTLTIGVCFEPQLVADLPVEEHDVQLDLVVTDAGPAGGVDPGGYTSS